MLELRDVHTYYGRSYILQGVNLQVRGASVVSLLGRNGMGKTTTVRTIIGFTPPERGKITFKDREITGLKPFKIARMGIALVPQGRRIFSSLTVRENLTMSARPRNDQDPWTLGKVYSLFPILEKRARHKGTVLSGGEQSMLNIARALMTNPELLLMDEPSEGLAPIMVIEVGRVITRLKEGGISIFLVEQNSPFSMRVSDYIYVMSKGVIVYETPPSDLARGEEAMVKFLGVSR